jgi:hypothetical protein
MHMRGYREGTQRRRPRNQRTGRKVPFSLAVTGAAVALLSLMASAEDGFTARATSVTPAIALLGDIPSHNRAYRASMISFPDAIERNRPLTLTLEIRTAAGLPVEGATLALDTWMPDNAQMDGARPREISELGGGFYRLEGLRFESPGWWNLRLQVSAAGLTDSLAFNVVLR